MQYQSYIVVDLVDLINCLLICFQVGRIECGIRTILHMMIDGLKRICIFVLLNFVCIVWWFVNCLCRTHLYGCGGGPHCQTSSCFCKGAAYSDLQPSDLHMFSTIRTECIHVSTTFVYTVLQIKRDKSLEKQNDRIYLCK